jgi:predicted glycosyltransferase
VLSEPKPKPATVWIDIENPPQVQYLLPFWQEFEATGLRTVITARDYGSTVSMLEQAGVRPNVFGTRVGRGKARKAVAGARRARELWRFVARTGKPDAVLSASRAAVLVAWGLGVPSWVINDYEHAFLGLTRVTRSKIIFPDVIDPAVYRSKGFRAEQLIPVKGIKEDLTFAGVDVDAFAPYDIGAVPDDAVRVLFRPPAETSHYYREASSTMARVTLERLSRADAFVVFSPREPGQVGLLEGLPWKHQPLTLSRSVPFVPLLKSVDLVICSGGTMLREAAYLGVPAYSIFQSEIGGVDRWLQSIGRATLIAGPEDLSRIELRPRGPISRLDSNPDLLKQLAEHIAHRAAEQRTPSRRRALMPAAARDARSAP